jgi:FtsZ-binding cell division protein ZapB
MNWLWRRWVGWRGWRGTVVRQRYLQWPEWLGMAVWVLCLAGVVTGYQMLLEPLNQRLSRISRETSNLRRQTENLRMERQRLEQEAAAFNGAMENWRRFERELLRDARVGQLALIDEINALARKHDVKLTDTVAFLLTDQNKGPAAGASSREPQNQFIQSYPTFEVKLGITGNYRNIRRFIHALEQSRQFLLLQLLSFTPGERPLPSGGMPSGAVMGENPANPNELTIALSLTAYFRSEPGAPLGGPVSAARQPQPTAGPSTRPQP